MEFNVIHFLAEWLKLVCFNFLFAFFSQLFFIQPIVRTVFKAVFKKDLEKRKQEATEKEKMGEKLMSPERKRCHSIMGFIKVVFNQLYLTFSSSSLQIRERESGQNASRHPLQ